MPGGRYTQTDSAGDSTGMVRLLIGAFGGVEGAAYWRRAWRIPLNHPCATATDSICKITLTTCSFSWELFKRRPFDTPLELQGARTFMNF